MFLLDLLMLKVPTSSHSTTLPDLDLLRKFSLLPHADVILHSCNSHDFLVQKLYVIDSSPVLGEQIMATMSHGAGLEGKPHSMNCFLKRYVNNSYF